MQAIRTLLADEEPHADAYRTISQCTTPDGVKQARNRRLALLEQVAAFIAGGDNEDKKKLIADFVARHSPKLAKSKLKKIDEESRANMAQLLKEKEEREKARQI